MPNLGFPEIMIILVVALLVFGPKKLPELGKSLGNGIREFRKSTQGLKDELSGAANPIPVHATTTEVIAPVVQPAVTLASPEHRA